MVGSRNMSVSCDPRIEEICNKQNTAINARNSFGN